MWCARCLRALITCKHIIWCDKCCPNSHSMTVLCHVPIASITQHTGTYGNLDVCMAQIVYDWISCSISGRKLCFCALDMWTHLCGIYVAAGVKKGNHQHNIKNVIYFFQTVAVRDWHFWRRFPPPRSNGRPWAPLSSSVKAFLRPWTSLLPRG